MKRMTIAAAAIFLTMCALVQTALADEYLEKRLLEGQDFIFARRYDDALKVFEELKEKYPNSPAGSFGEMAMYEVRMLENEDFHLEKPFKEASKEGLARVSRMLQSYNPSAWDLFMCGALYGLDGFFKARKGDWWGAYVQGNRSKQLFKHVKGIDPKFADADFGLGMYMYWRSVFIKDLWFLSFFPDKRAEGIAIVEGVARDGKFAKEMARVNLGIIYFEEKRYDEAMKVFEEYVKKYPNNVVLRRLLGKSFVAKKKYKEAIEQFRASLAVDPELKKPYYFIGAALVLTGNPKSYPEAEEALRHFLKIEKGRYWQASAHYWLGRLCEAKGENTQAIAEYGEAHKLDPKIEDAVKRVRGMGGGM
jgi:tetratricopeptide (TPR) repeat protein